MNMPERPWAAETQVNYQHHSEFLTNLFLLGAEQEPQYPYPSRAGTEAHALSHSTVA